MADQLLNHTTTVSTCRNCGEYIEKNFCTHCGQKSNEHRIHLRSVLHDIPHTVFHLDHGFFFNVIVLFSRPGAAIRDYLAGRRKPFYHPITYLALLLVFNLFAVKVTNLHYYDPKELLTMSASEVQFIKAYDASQWWFLEHTYLYMLVAIPLGALFSYFFFRAFGIRHNYAEHLIIFMFIIAQGVLVQSVLYLLTGWVHNGRFIRSMETVDLLLMISYAVYACYRFIAPAKKKWRTFGWCVAAGIMMLSIMLASAYALMYASKAI
ncbi:MAG: DUF3667 domain-containing protein [Chitinophagaceae bacterium]